MMLGVARPTVTDRGRNAAEGRADHLSARARDGSRSREARSRFVRMLPDRRTIFWTTSRRTARRPAPSSRADSANGRYEYVLPLRRHQREQTADDADDERAEKRRQKSADVESQVQRIGQRAREPEHEAVDHEQEQTERENHDRKREDLRERADECVHHAEDERDAEERHPAAGVGDARHDAGRDPQPGGVDEKTDEERQDVFLACAMSAASIWL